MRILNVVTQYWPYMGGAPNYIKEMSERFVKDGNEVTVYTTNAWDLEYLFFSDRARTNLSTEVIKGVKVKRYPVRHFSPNSLTRQLLGRIPLRASKFLFRFPSAILPELWRDLLIEGRRYDLIHATPSPFYSLIYPAYIAARFWRKPFAVTPFVHTGTPRGDSQIAMHTHPDQVSVLKASDLVIVQSAVEKKALIEKGIPGCKINILGMGVNPDDISGGNPEHFRSRYIIAEKDKIIAYVGALIHDKGAFHLLDAFVKLKKQLGHVRLVMAGHASVEFQNYFNEKPDGVKKSCILMGNVGGEDKASLFQACDVLALPSRADSYGIVFLEAWLAGKPVIGAYAGGIPEVISDGEDGFLVPFGDVHMLSEYLSHLMKDPELCRRMGQKGREKVLRSCTWDQRYHKIKYWFEDLARHR